MLGGRDEQTSMDALIERLMDSFDKHASFPMLSHMLENHMLDARGRPHDARCELVALVLPALVPYPVHHLQWVMPSLNEDAVFHEAMQTVAAWVGHDAAKISTGPELVAAQRALGALGALACACVDTRHLRLLRRSQRKRLRKRAEQRRTAERRAIVRRCENMRSLLARCDVRKKIAQPVLDDLCPKQRLEHRARALAFAESEVVVHIKAQLADLAEDSMRAVNKHVLGPCTTRRHMQNWDAAIYAKDRHETLEFNLYMAKGMVAGPNHFERRTFGRNMGGYMFEQIGNVGDYFDDDGNFRLPMSANTAECYFKKTKRATLEDSRPSWAAPLVQPAGRPPPKRWCGWTLKEGL